MKEVKEMPRAMKMQFIISALINAYFANVHFVSGMTYV